MAIVIRFSKSEHVLRSTDEHPGIIGIGPIAVDDDGLPAFAIYSTPNYEPAPAAGQVVAKMQRRGQRGIVTESIDLGPNGSQDLTVLDTAAVINGCVSAGEVAAVMQCTGAIVSQVAELAVPRLRFEGIVAATQFAIEVRDLVTARLQAEGWA